MKHSSATYRLNMIKQAATRKQHENEMSETNPMADYINHLLIEKPQSSQKSELKHNFSGSHFDENAGGWVSDLWK